MLSLLCQQGGGAHQSPRQNWSGSCWGPKGSHEGWHLQGRNGENSLGLPAPSKVNQYDLIMSILGMNKPRDVLGQLVHVHLELFSWYPAIFSTEDSESLDFLSCARKESRVCCRCQIGWFMSYCFSKKLFFTNDRWSAFLYYKILSNLVVKLQYPT